METHLGSITKVPVIPEHRHISIVSLGMVPRFKKVNEFIFSQIREYISGFLLIDTKVALEPIYKELCSLYIDELNIYFAQDVSNTDFHWLAKFSSRKLSKGKMLNANV